MPNLAPTWTSSESPKVSTRVRRLARPLLMTAGSVSGTSALAWLLRSRLQLEDIALVYLVGTLVVASRCTVAQSIAAAAAHAVAFDYVFIPPPFAFTLFEFKSAVNFVAIGVVAAALALSQQRLKRLERSASLRAHTSSTMYSLVRELGASTSIEQIAFVTCRNIERITGGHAQIVDTGSNGPDLAAARLSHDDTDAVREAWSSRGCVVRGSPGKYTLAAPILAARAVVGVLLVREAELHPSVRPDLPSLLEQCVQAAGAAIERNGLLQEMQRALAAIETEQMQNSLLSAASQDFRTPIAAIKAAGETMLSRGSELSAQTTAELATSIVRESDRLMLVVHNLLNLLRVESGTIPLQLTEIGVEDLISVSLRRLGLESANRRLVCRIPDDLPLLSVDAVLMELVITNVLDNAMKCAPSETPIELEARHDDDDVVLRVADRGRGLADGEESRLFQKFVRGHATSTTDGGLGIGLTVSRAVLVAHGGSIRLTNRNDGPGAVAELRIPAARRRPLPDEQGDGSVTVGVGAR